MFKKQLEKFFLALIAVALGIIIYNFYQSHTFRHSPLSKKSRQNITKKEMDVLENMKKVYGVYFRVPIIVTDKFKGRLYGLTSYENGKITIYLNKKVMQESMQYILDNVIAHEYAHALMFRFKKFRQVNSGHSQEWKSICINLGGKDCRQYVNQHEVIMGKLPF